MPCGKTQTPISPTALAARMAALNPVANTFAVDLSAAGAEFEGHSLVGATPEVLVSRRGRVVTCRPLAGTTKRSADADQDREAGESLLHSTKNLAEHAFVTSWIREVLQPMCSDLSVPATPELTNTHEVWHLASPIRGTLRDLGANSLDRMEIVTLSMENLGLHFPPRELGVPGNIGGLVAVLHSRLNA